MNNTCKVTYGYKNSLHNKKQTLIRVLIIPNIIKLFSCSKQHEISNNGRREGRKVERE